MWRYRPHPGDPGVWAWGWGKGQLKSQQPWGCPQGSEQSLGVGAMIPVPPLTLVEISNSATASLSAEWGRTVCHPSPESLAARCVLGFSIYRIGALCMT